MIDALAEKISEIDVYKEKINSLCVDILNSDSGRFFSMDFLAVAAIRRSMSLSEAFSLLVGQKNYCCAAVHVRLQIDSCIRFFALFIVNDPVVFCDNILNGSSIRSMKDAQGKQMTDSYLVSIIAKEHSWIERVYKESSGFIHLSNKHIFSAFSSGEKEMTISLSTSPVDDNVAEHLWVEMIDAFLAATDLLLNYLTMWLYIKKKGNFAWAPKVGQLDSN